MGEGCRITSRVNACESSLFLISQYRDTKVFAPVPENKTNGLYFKVRRPAYADQAFWSWWPAVVLAVWIGVKAGFSKLL